MPAEFIQPLQGLDQKAVLLQEPTSGDRQMSIKTSQPTNLPFALLLLLGMMLLTPILAVQASLNREPSVVEDAPLSWERPLRSLLDAGVRVALTCGMLG